MTEETTARTIENLYSEERTFSPPEEFVAQANLSDPEIYDRAAADPEAFWAGIARETITWRRDFDTTLEWNLPYAKWFVGGKLNVAENCLDRHIDAGHGDRVAYHWEGEPGDTRTITYASCSRTSPAWPTCCAALASRRATGWSSTCR
jgi:acetyl-CoA synthetase